MEKRPAIPEEIKRQVLMEAGHRCAIPTCKFPTTEIAHIVPWAESNSNDFYNLIALCPNCHTRYDKGEIDRKSMKLYKQNLGIIYSRYGDLEKRILQFFVVNPGMDGIWLPGDFDILVYYLVRDGIIIDTKQTNNMFIAGIPVKKLYALSLTGKEIISNLRTGKLIV